MIEALAYEEVVEDCTQVRVSRLFIQPTRTDAVERRGEFSQKTLARICPTDRLLRHQERGPPLPNLALGDRAGGSREAYLL